MANENEPIDEGPRSFARFFEHLAHGEAHVEASEALHELAQVLGEQAAATQSTVKGELKLTIRMAVEKSGIVSVGYDVSTKEPKPQRSAGVFWLSKGGNLLREDPRQSELNFPRDVSAKRDEAKDVGSDSDAKSV